MRRRDFLKTAAAAPLALAVGERGRVKIDRVEVFPVRYPMSGYFKFFTGPHGSQGRAAVIVKLTAADGTVGWGQSVPIARWSYETLETATVALREYFAPVLRGREPTDIAGLHRRLDRAIAPGFSTGMPITRAGIDIALWDLVGKLAKKPLAELWGRKPGGKIVLSWTVNARSLEEAEAVIEAGRQRGYEHFNVKVAPDPEYDVALVKRVRKAAPRAHLWADANGGYDPETALAAAPRLADAGLDALESPLRPNRLSGYRRLVRQGALPILMDEGVVSPVELEEFIKLGMLNGVAMKPSRCGGLTSNRAQLDLVEKHGLMWLGSGLTDPDISLAASLILYAAHGLKTPAALNGPQFLTTDVLAHPLRIEKAVAEAPVGPGLGIEVDEARVRRMAGR